MPDPTPVLARLDADRAGALDRLSALLRVPSVSAQPAHAADCARAAEWLADALRTIGFRAAVHPTAGHPVVLAHHPGTGRPGPRLLFYGHYDVQPPEPLDLWTSPPFEPTVVAGPRGPRVVARGAVDDKGQVCLWLEALRAFHAEAGGPPMPVSVLIEGEEEVGSPNLDAFLLAHRDALAADLAVISDTGMWDPDTPALTTRLRGLAYLQLTLRAASRDLHSGLYGGAARNPLNLLTEILGALRGEGGRVALPGFLDGVREPTEAERAAWAGLGFDEAAFLGGVGLSVPAGEAGRGALERLWARPTLDVHGLWGGYDGPGSKTVIPGEAGAKLSFRLVPGQDPEAVVAAFRRFVSDRVPADVRAQIEVFGVAPGIELPPGPFLDAARAALADEFGRAAVLTGSGGSIPVVESLRRILGVDSLLMGFGLDDDQVHSPNEKFDLACFHRGARAHARLLARLAG